MEDEIIYCYQRGSGWYPQYKDVIDFIDDFDKRVLERVLRVLRADPLAPYTTTRQITITGTAEI